MNKIAKFLLVVFWIMLYTNHVAAEAPAVPGRAAVLIDGLTGRVLYEKNGDAALPMASTTKILTALVALKEGDLADMVMVQPEAQGVEGSSVWLSAGEVHTLEDLLYALMLRSGNDAATAIALHIGGDVPSFAWLMNAYARRLGAQNSNFVNPHGLHHDQHYTTAKDLGRLAYHAMHMPDFERIVSAKYHTIPWEGHEWDRAMKNKNKLLWSLEGANGIKTGYTKKAGRCLVGAAKRADLQFISVVLNCGPMFETASDLLEYGFKYYVHTELARAGDILRMLPVEGARIAEVPLTAERGSAAALAAGEAARVKKTLKLPESLKAPVEQGAILGSVSFYLDDALLDEVPLIAGVSAEKKGFFDFFKKLLDQLEVRHAPAKAYGILRRWIPPGL